MALPKEFTTVTTLSKILAGTLFVAMPFIGFYLGMKYQTALVAPISTPPVVTESLKSATKPEVADVKKYVDTTLKYGFSYPTAAEFLVRADSPGGVFDQYSLRVEPLIPYYLPKIDPVTRLLESDLYCSAGGPGTSIECQNTKVEKFTNGQGVAGYKIYRTVNRNSKLVTADSIAYVFPVSGSKEYSGVLFALDPSSETPANQAFLLQLVNSFVNL